MQNTALSQARQGMPAIFGGKGGIRSWMHRNILHAFSAFVPVHPSVTACKPSTGRFASLRSNPSSDVLETKKHPFWDAFSFGGKGGIRSWMHRNILHAFSAFVPVHPSVTACKPSTGRFASLRSNPSSDVLETKKHPFWDAFSFGGKGGIRTLGRVLADTRFPVVRLRPAQPPFHCAPVLYHIPHPIATPFLKFLIIFLPFL